MRWFGDSIGPSAIVRLASAASLPLGRRTGAGVQVCRPPVAVRYSRQGMNLDRPTLADWVDRAAGHRRPVIRKVTIESALAADGFSLALDDAGYAVAAA